LNTLYLLLFFKKWWVLPTIFPTIFPLLTKGECPDIVRDNKFLAEAQSPAEKKQGTDPSQGFF